ncbi:MAG: hypothetical protein AB7D34_01170 [Sulfurimonas sp.]
MGRSRQLLQYGSNAGLAQLAGAAGFGFEKAGKQMVDLGGEFVKQENYDAALAAAEKEKIAKSNALNVKNSIVNPDAVKKINDKYGVESPEAKNALGLVDLGAPAEKKNITLKEGERVYSPDGKQIIDFPKSPEAKKVSKTIVDPDNKVHIVFTDGTTQPTGLSSKDWNKSGDKAPDGYKFAGEFSIDDELDYELIKAGAYFTDDKSGKTYVNVDKYRRLIDLGNTEVK